jgi:two-component system LytT family response regulator
VTTVSPHRVLVADDELPSRQYVCELVRQDPRFEVVAVSDSGQSTVAQSQEIHLDAVFLDIQMPGMDGFEVLEALHGSNPLVVFVTAYGDYALQAFENEAFDYVKKPIDPSRFSRVLDRIHQRLVEKKIVTSQSPQVTSTNVTKTISTSSIQQEKKILNAVRQDLVYQESEIQLIESASNYVDVRINGESHLVRETLENFCRSLSSTDFVRVHRSFVVNVRWVHKMQYGKSGSAELCLVDGHLVPVSRSRRKEVASIIRRLIDPSDMDDYVI